MVGEIGLLFAGFVLTTVFGGLVGTYFGGNVEIHDCGLERLNDLVYRFVAYMTSHIRDGTIGRRFGEPIPAPTAP